MGFAIWKAFSIQKKKSKLQIHFTQVKSKVTKGHQKEGKHRELELEASKLKLGVFRDS